MNFTNNKIHRQTIQHTQGSYDVILGRNILQQFPRFIPESLNRSRFCIITDRNVARHYLAGTTDTLEQYEYTALPAFIIAPGERSKSFATFRRIHTHFCSIGMSRNDFIIALGGGVTGDLTGFAAATFMRGIPFLQLPTTLLAQVDSSIGGKTGINLPAGKNLVGAFHFPSLVAADLQTLDTLPQRELINGLAEIIKIAVISDAKLFTFLVDSADSILETDQRATLQQTLFQACCLKADIVKQDEREKGVRALLNFGHTFGHAIEKTMGYKNILHGEAVALGMLAATFMAINMDMCDPCLLPELKQILQNSGLPVHLPNTDMGVIIDTMKLDKKCQSGKVRFILPEQAGKVRITSKINKKSIREALDYLNPL
ncbi:3-dehydroquinate synthase [bacterium]|nr:3-dehydroquinate synthase [bacterium]